MTTNTSKISGSFEELIDNDKKKSIEDLFDKIKKDNEFEISFLKEDRNYENYLRILKYLTYKSNIQKLKLEKETSLDINYSQKNTLDSYRLTIYSLESINKYLEMLHSRKNHIIMSVLVNLVEKDKNLQLMKKIKKKTNIIDIIDFNLRVRLSEENELTKKEIDMLKNLTELNRNDIIFRYKQRISLIIEDDNNKIIRIDLTDVKMSDNINKIQKNPSLYELEIEYFAKSDKTPEKTSYNTLLKEISVLLKIIQQSNYLITKQQTTKILSLYADLMDSKLDSLTGLNTRKAISLEVQHVVDQLPNKYGVSDKADGDRYLLFIVDNICYLISDNLVVKNIGIKLEGENRKYNYSLIDGEYIFIKNQNRHIYLGFDCLFNGNTDLRQISSFKERLNNLSQIINDCFIFKGQKGNKDIKFSGYTGKFNIDEIMKFHEKQIDEYMENLNHDIKIEKQYPLVRRKYFACVEGGQDNEIFKYSELIWNKYVLDKKTNCPYMLDGLIFHPLDQKYIVSVKETKYFEYKWKPPEKNSIDFYIQLEKSQESGNIIKLYDNSDEDTVKNKPYKIVNLFVGKFNKGIEQPVPFLENNNSNKAKLYLIDGEIRDIEGNIIMDNTVVEFYYDNNPEIPEINRWIPLRTRYDKTESVQRFNKKYGNYIDIASKIWRSIKNPVLIDDIITLSNDKMYSKHIDLMRSKIDHSIIMSARQENVYYQIRTNIGKPMRNFHNWIKSILIYTYCNPKYEEDRQFKILDIGCGRGGDIMKFYYSKVNMYVGIDVDNNGIISPVDGALSRYNRLKRTHPNFPRMYFINADITSLLNYNEQLKTIGNMSLINKNLINTFFSDEPSKRTLFDRINCQFALHYFLKNQITWDNFTKNINDYLNPDGYLILTCFDGDTILNLLNNTDKYASYYTNTEGEQKIFFEILKRYENIKSDDNIGLGVAIDVHNALISQEGVYITEYLVQKEFLIKELFEKCKLELVDTDMFSNQFNKHKDYFTKIIEYEENPNTRQFLINVREFYDQNNEVNKSSYEMSKLNRYYIFRKQGKEGYVKEIYSKDVDSKFKSTKKIQKGGDINYDDIEDIDILEFLDNKYKYKTEDINSKYSLYQSVFNIMKKSKIIPESLLINEFYSDLDIELVSDEIVSDNHIKKLCKNIKIGHTNSEESNIDLVLNGMNIGIIYKDCDGCELKRFKYKSSKNIMYLLNENQSYKPIYDNNINGIFDL